MKQFSDREARKGLRKGLMKKGLAALLIVAWMPIAWMLLSALLSPLFLQLGGSMVLAQAVIVPLTVAVLLLFLRILQFMGEKFYG